MTSYKIFLTKSMEVAAQLAEFNSSKVGSENPKAGLGNLKHVRLGVVNQMKEYVPEIYHDQSYFCCILMYESEKPSYNIIIA